MSSAGNPVQNVEAVPFSVARFALLVSGVMFFVAVLRFGWAADDGFITIRSVDNLLRGDGFGVNVGDRVQSFTSPLWALLCIPFLAATKSPYLALVIPGIVCSAAVAAILVRGFRQLPWQGATTLLTLTASTSFLGFSTSGLENSLAHMLAALYCLERFHKGTEATRTTFLLAACLTLTRFDYALVVAPGVTLALIVGGKRGLKNAVPAAALVLSWLVFAVAYFGFAFPNTAYAKLNTEIPLGARVTQGFTYLLDSAFRDPIVPITILVAILLGFQRRGTAQVRLVLAGVVLYLGYVVAIGGDFMSGRFLTVCFLLAALVTVHVIASLHDYALPAACAVLVFFGTASLGHATREGADCDASKTGITDERTCYVANTGLLENVRGTLWKRHGFLKDYRDAVKSAKSNVVLFGTVGLATYGSEHRVHILEPMALSEPLLARIRLPMIKGWRPGHYARAVPKGYRESLETGKNLIADPCLHELYERLRIVIRGPFFSVARIRAIWELNTSHRVCPSPT